MNLLEFIKLCLLGLIQGITEPLPISSSAHMLIIDAIFKINATDLSFVSLINFASTLAIAFFFRKKIFNLVKNIFTKHPITNEYSYLNRHFLLLLVIGSIPAGVIGFFFNDLIDFYFTNYKFASLCLLLTSIILFITYKIAKSKIIFLDDLTIGDSIIIGLMQMLALLPGISRSGATIFGGITRNIKLKRILDFSFFLYLIASTGAFFLAVIKIDWFLVPIFTYIIPFIIAFISTYFSIKWFYHRLNTTMMLGFSLYCAVIGLIVFFFI